MPVIRLKPGDTAASVAPRKNRVTIIPAKFDETAWQARTPPQKKLLSGFQSAFRGLATSTTAATGTHTVNAMNFAIGSRTMIIDAG
jgi:hypothetical protein